MDIQDRDWARKGATLSDKTARSEYGLTQDEIFDAIDAGTLQYRPGSTASGNSSGLSSLSSMRGGLCFFPNSASSD